MMSWLSPRFAAVRPIPRHWQTPKSKTIFCVKRANKTGTRPQLANFIAENYKNLKTRIYRLVSKRRSSHQLGVLTSLFHECALQGCPARKRAAKDSFELAQETWKKSKAGRKPRYLKPLQSASKWSVCALFSCVQFTLYYVSFRYHRQEASLITLII